MTKEIVDVPVFSDVIKKLNIPLSAVVKANGFVFVSGLPAFDLKTGNLIRGDMEDPTPYVPTHAPLDMETPAEETRP